MTALLQVLALFLLMLCGLGAVLFRLLDDRGLKGLNTLVLYFAQPVQQKTTAADAHGISRREHFAMI